MRLRTHVRRPGRYREDDIEELPPNPTFVVPTIAFNPNLRPAVFPTLRWDELPPDHPCLISEELECLQEGREEAAKSESAVELEEVREERIERPAIVFRDTRTVPLMEQQEGLIQLPDGTWVAIEEPGQCDVLFELWGNEDKNQSLERWFPSVFAKQKYWSDLSNGMRLVLIRELTYQMNFYDAVLFLCLEERELEEFLNLCVDEIKVREAEDARVARTQDRQMALMALMDSGDWSVGGDEWGRIFEEEMRNGGETRMPATWLISKEDIAIAKNFMGNFRFKEEYPEVAKNFDEVDHIPTFAILSSIMDRLDLYIGVDTTFKELNFGGDFLAYLPRDVLVVEDVPGSSSFGTAREAPDDPSPISEQVVDYIQPSPTMAPKPSRSHKDRSTMKKSTKKDIEKDGITVDLIKKSRRGRPRKADQIDKAGPSTLRQVLNAEDLQTPSQSPTLPANHDAGPAPITQSTQELLARSVTPTWISVQNLGRSPFKQYLSSTPPPKHSASFIDGFPVQPASSSPHKASTVASPYFEVLKPSTPSIQSAANIQPTAIVQLAPGVQSAATVRPTTSVRSPKKVSAPSSSSVAVLAIVHSDGSYAIQANPSEPPLATSTLTLKSTPASDMANSKSSKSPKTASSSTSTSELVPTIALSGVSHFIPANPSKPLNTASASSSSLDTHVTMARLALGLTPASLPALSSINTVLASTRVSDPNTIPATNPQTSEHDVAQMSKQVSAYDSTAQVNALSPFPSKPTPKITLDNKKKRARNQPQSFVSTSSELSLGKRSRAEEVCSNPLIGQLLKKPCLEQLDQTAQTFLGKLIDGVTGAISNKINTFKITTDSAANPDDMTNHSSTINDDNREIHTQLDKPNPATSIDRLDAIGNLQQPQTPSKSSASISKLPSKPRKGPGTKAEGAKPAKLTLLQDVADQATNAADSSEKLGAHPRIIEEETRSEARHARKSSQLGTESVNSNRENPSTPEPTMTENFPTPSKSRVEVQIPASKRAASELLPGWPGKEGPPAKKLKTGEASAPIPPPANGVTHAKAGPQKKGFNTKVVKKATSQFQPSQNDESPSLFAARPASMIDATPQKKPTTGKKAANQPEATQAKTTSRPKATSRPKVTPQQKAPVQPKTARAASAKPKATPKLKREHKGVTPSQREFSR